MLVLNTEDPFFVVRPIAEPERVPDAGDRVSAFYHAWM